MRLREEDKREKKQLLLEKGREDRRRSRRAVSRPFWTGSDSNFCAAEGIVSANFCRHFQCKGLTSKRFYTKSST